MKSLGVALHEPDSLVLLLSPSLRQSGELFKKVSGFYSDLGKPVPATQETALTLTLENKSRIISLPGSPDTIRGFSRPRLVVIDEAALTTDDLIVAVSPMLAIGGGSLVCLSTPMGKRGWFYEAWESDAGPWLKIKATADDCPRITPEFIAEQVAIQGERNVRQEFFCSFEETMDQYLSTASINAAFGDNEGMDLTTVDEMGEWLV